MFMRILYKYDKVAMDRIRMGMPRGPKDQEPVALMDA